MIAIIALILSVLMGMGNQKPSPVVIIPAKPQYYPSPVVIDHDENEWFEYFVDAYQEYADEFAALFNATEVKWSRNNRLMIKPAGATSFKFAKKG